jgi:hypothetical protein
MHRPVYFLFLLLNHLQLNFYVAYARCIAQVFFLSVEYVTDASFTNSFVSSTEYARRTAPYFSCSLDVAYARSITTFLLCMLDALHRSFVFLEFIAY